MRYGIVGRMGLFSFFKKFPLDLGQKELRYRTRSSRLAVELCGNGYGGRLLDLGCASGFWSEKLKQREWVVSSVDIRTEYLPALQHDLNLGIPYPNNEFDMVFSTATIAYMRNPEYFLSEVRRVLKPQGRFVITTPNLGFWPESILRIFGRSLRDLADQDQKSFFDISSIRKLFPGAALYGYFPYFPPMFTIRRMVGLLSPVFVAYGAKKDL
jgi:SAM-dependent methyltransferase